MEQRGWLDWWANASTLLGSVEVAVVAGGDPAGGEEARGWLVNEQDAEEFAFLCDLDPVFALRFADASTFVVAVRPSDDCRRFTLTEHIGTGGRDVLNRLDL